MEQKFDDSSFGVIGVKKKLLATNHKSHLSFPVCILHYIYPVLFLVIDFDFFLNDWFDPFDLMGFFLVLEIIWTWEMIL